MSETIGIVVSDFNRDITELMLKVAEEHAKFLGASVKRVINVPGAFDIPLAVKKLLEMKEIEGVVTLGAVIEGDTAHDEIVANNAARKIADLALQYDKPVSLGISGPGMNRMDGIKRVDEYGKRAVDTCIKMIRRIK
jgi:6,7-dimethyl-8-ribityllumazine synthase